MGLQYGLMDKNGKIVLEPLFEGACFYNSKGNVSGELNGVFKKLSLKEAIYLASKIAKKITHEELADFLGTNEQTLYKWKTNEKEFKQKIYKFLRTFSKDDLESILKKDEKDLSDNELSKILKMNVSSIRNWRLSQDYQKRIYDILKRVDLKDF